MYRSGSGSGSCSGSESFYHHAKIVRKTLIPYYFVTLFDFLSLKNDVNVASKSNKQKKLWRKIIFFADILKVNDENIRIRIQDPGSRSGSISQRHGSADPDPDSPQNVMEASKPP
jgi:hypothetical protein